MRVLITEANEPLVRRPAGAGRRAHIPLVVKAVHMMQRASGAPCCSLSVRLG